jgi:hypothetical protein
MAIKQLEPYVNEIKMDDPMIERVPVEKTSIGANASGLPKVGRNNMGMQHVAGGVGGARG